MVNHNEQDRTIDNSVRGRKVTPEEVAYRDGYVRGRAHEDQVYREELRRRQAQKRTASTRNWASGVYFGVILFILIAVIGGIFLTLSRQNSGVTDQTPQNSDAVTPETPEPETNILERTQEVIPSPSEVIQPDIEINLPEPDLSEPASESSPEATSQPEAETNPEN